MSLPAGQKSSRASGANALIALLTLVLVTGAALCGVVTSATLYGAIPDPVPPTAPPTEFSSGRALEHVRVIAKEPHPMGSPENMAVRDYLVKELRALGLEPEVQKATPAHYWFHNALLAGRPQNVVARLDGTNDGGKAFVLMAHYDSVPAAPGASDDGAGVATMLETLRALKTGSPLKNDVIFLFTEGEERGLLGARAFVDSHRWARDVGVVLNLETRGNTGPAFVPDTSDEAGWAIREFAKAAPYPMTTSDSVAFYERSGADSDLRVFFNAGLTGLHVAYTGGLTNFHTPLDTPEALDERSLQHMGSYALPLARHFGNVSLDRTKAPDEVYFNLSRFLVHYPEAWSIPFMAIVVLLFVGVAALGFGRRQLTLGGVALGFLALLGSMIAAALVAYLLWTLIHTLHPGGIRALEYKSSLFWTGFAGLAVAITAALYAGLREKIRVANLAVGALLWWLLLAVATGVYFAPGSYLFAWPLLFSLLGLGAYFALGDRPARPWYPFAALALSVVPAVLLPALGVYGVTLTQGLSPSAVPVFALAIVLMMGLMIPHLDLIAGPNRWAMPGAAATLGLGLLVFGALTAGFDSRHPRPDSILYALNADTEQAIWASGDEAPDAWTAQFLGDDAKKGSMADYLGPSADPMLHGEAPTVDLAAPDVALLGDGTRDWGRALHMRVTAPPEADLVVVEADARVVGAEIDGKRVSEETLHDGGIPAWTLNYWNPPDQGLDLTLEVEGAGPLTVTARAGTPGLPSIPGKSYRDRPPDTMPITIDSTTIGQDDSTVVSKSFTFAAPPGNEQSK
jgi:MFS family permease